MPVIKSQLKPRSEEFRANAARMQRLVADLREKVAQAAAGGPDGLGDEDLCLTAIAVHSTGTRSRIGSNPMKIGAHNRLDPDTPVRCLVRRSYPWA